jgi:hypothetical protein
MRRLVKRYGYDPRKHKGKNTSQPWRYMAEHEKTVSERAARVAAREGTVSDPTPATGISGLEAARPDPTPVEDHSHGLGASVGVTKRVVDMTIADWGKRVQDLREQRGIGSIMKPRKASVYSVKLAGAQPIPPEAAKRIAKLMQERDANARDASLWRNRKKTHNILQDEGWL